ncbi:MAG TPA: hypothetical protein VFS67_06925 [Polyangiaceae bacterium]|nr:hypothetical protein [Polyangiaceae bacterium]
MATVANIEDLLSNEGAPAHQPGRVSRICRWGAGRISKFWGWLTLSRDYLSRLSDREVATRALGREAATWFEIEADAPALVEVLVAPLWVAPSAQSRSGTAPVLGAEAEANGEGVL